MRRTVSTPGTASLSANAPGSGTRTTARKNSSGDAQYTRENPDKISEYNKRWRRENPGRATELWREWCKANPERAREIDARHRAKRRAAMSSTTVGPVSYRQVLEDFGMVCHICDTEIADMDDLHFDHVIPLSRGGPHVQENIRPAHADCNRRKSDKLMSELGDIAS